MFKSQRHAQNTRTYEQTAKFVSGSTMSHIIHMTLSGGIGLMAIFLVDLADIYFLSQLGIVEITAGMGYAGAIVFFVVSLAIGLSIAAGALTSHAIGRENRDEARRLATHVLFFSVAFSALLSLCIYFFIPQILGVLGAKGAALAYAADYLYVLIPSMIFLTAGICATALLRAVGDARWAMLVTLAGAGVNAVLDPLFIFTLDMGMEGAAAASVLARATIMTLGLYGVWKTHDLLTWVRWKACGQDMSRILKIAIPATLTNIATPTGNAFVTYFITRYGAEAVAAWAIINRIVPVVFGGLFALSGAVGPIIGQNLGAARFDRLRQILRDALRFNLAYSLGVWLLLVMFSPVMARMFHVSQMTEQLVREFCLWMAPAYLFMGFMFSANAAFNNLGRPFWSTLNNWGRATLGNLPFLYLGGLIYGAAGMIAGNMFGAVLFGCGAIYCCFRLIEDMEKERKNTRITSSMSSGFVAGQFGKR